MPIVNCRNKGIKIVRDDGVIFRNARQAGDVMRVSRKAINDAVRNGTTSAGHRWSIQEDHDEQFEIWRRHTATGLLCSNKGRVKGRYGKTYGSKRMDGYMVIHVGRKGYLVHTLIAETFMERPTGREVDHNNKRRDDNRVTNLEWVTRRENCKRRYQ